MNKMRAVRRWSVVVAGWVVGVSTVASGAGVDLNRCVAEALRLNPGLQATVSRLEAAKAAEKAVSSAYYPQLGLSSTWARTDNPPQAFFMALNQRRASLQKDFNNPEDTDNIRGSVGAQWRLFDSGRRDAERRSARDGSDAARHLTDAARNELAHQVTRAYYGILQSRAFVGVQQETVNSIGESLRVAQERVKAGAAIKTDVLNLEVEQSQAEEELIRARNGLQLAVAALNTAVGQDLLDPAQVGDLADVPVQADRALQGAEGIDSRPELGAAASQSRAMEAMVERARREYMPVVNLFGSVDWDSDRLSDFEQSYLAGATAEVNVFDGFRARSEVSRARANVAAARAEESSLHAALRLDLTQAVLSEQEAWDRLEVSGKSLASAEEALRITRERYQAGAADITELMTAQVGLTATRSRQISARYDSLTARSNVARARGELGKKFEAE